jgi:hypothetical protein
MSSSNIYVQMNMPSDISISYGIIVGSVGLLGYFMEGKELSDYLISEVFFEPVTQQSALSDEWFFLLYPY